MTVSINWNAVKGVARLFSRVEEIAEAAANAEVASAVAPYVTAAQTAETNAETAETNAETAQAAAEVARDAALAAQRIYASSAAGLAATTNGQYYYVVSASSSYTLELWLNNAGVASDTGKRFPASSIITGNTALLYGLEGSGQYYKTSTDTQLTERTFVVGQNPSAGSTVVTGRTWIFARNPVPGGLLSEVQIRAAASGTVKVKRFTRSGQVFTWVDEISLSVVAGLNTFSLSAGTLSKWRWNEGDITSFYAPNNVGVSNASATPTTPYYEAPGLDVTTTHTIAAAGTALTATTQIEIKFSFTSSKHGDGMFPALQTVNGDTIYEGPVTPVVGNGYVTRNTTYINHRQLKEDRLLKRIRAYSDNAQQVIIHIFSYDEASDTFTTDRRFSITLAAGLNTLTEGIDFPAGIIVPAGGLIGHLINDWQGSGLKVDTGNDNFFYWSFTGSPSASFARSALVTGIQSEEHQISFELVGIKPVARQTYLFDQDYSAGDGLTYPFPSTAWTEAAGYITNSASGIANNRLDWRFITLVNGTARIIFEASAGEQIALFRSNSSSGGAGGSFVSVTVDTSTLAIHAGYSGGAAAPAVATSTTALTIVAGRKYRLDLTKHFRSFTVTLYDMVTGNSTSLTQAGDTDTEANGRCQGAPGFANLAGTSKVYRFSFSPLVKSPGVLLFGDSITDGSLSSTDAASWAYQVCANATDGGMVCAKGGITSTTLALRVEHECMFYRPRHAIVLIGTNDTVTATWQTNIANIEKAIRQSGATPWFCTLPVESGGDTNPELVMNPWLRSQGYRLIQMDRALTTNGDGLTRDASLYGDSLHPNTAGHAAMYARVRLDAPEIFD